MNELHAGQWRRPKSWRGYLYRILAVHGDWVWYERHSYLTGGTPEGWEKPETTERIFFEQTIVVPDLDAFLEAELANECAIVRRNVESVKAAA